MPTYPPEPFRIKMVEPIRLIPPEAREAGASSRPATTSSPCKAEDIFIDLLTDSGTGAMSQEQWAAIMRGDESYAGARSYLPPEGRGGGYLRLQVLRPHPPGTRRREHPGRAAGQARRLSSPPTCTSTPPTPTSAPAAGVPTNLVIDEAFDPANPHPFKGNMDIAKLTRLHREDRARRTSPSA